MSSVVGAAHLAANDWVQAVQNPAGAELSAIYDPIQKAQAGGTLTYQQASDALTTFNEQWSAFEQAAQQWTSQGGKYAQVVKQAMDPNGDFMKTVNMVKSNLTQWSDALKPPDSSTSATPGDPNNTATNPPDLNSILAALGLTPQDAARSAAVQQGKQAMAAPGYSSTLLGGNKGTPVTTKKTLLGGYSG